ncbi:MAG: hypothetical protein ACJ74W_01385 [Pyrinomonadaceae bacterium]
MQQKKQTQQPTRKQTCEEKDLGLALAKASRPPVVTTFKTSVGVVVRF